MIGVDAAPNVPFVGPKRRNSTAPAIDAPGARAEGDQLQEATGHGDVLEEMYHLVRVAEIAMRDQRGRNAPHRQYDPGWTRLIAESRMPPTHSTMTATIAASTGTGRPSAPIKATVPLKSMSFWTPLKMK